MNRRWCPAGGHLNTGQSSKSAIFLILFALSKCTCLSYQHEQTGMVVMFGQEIQPAGESNWAVAC